MDPSALGAGLDEMHEVHTVASPVQPHWLQAGAAGLAPQQAHIPIHLLATSIWPHLSTATQQAFSETCRSARDYCQGLIETLKCVAAPPYPGHNSLAERYQKLVSLELIRKAELGGLALLTHGSEASSSGSPCSPTTDQADGDLYQHSGAAPARAFLQAALGGASPHRSLLRLCLRGEWCFLEEGDVRLLVARFPQLRELLLQDLGRGELQRPALLRPLAQHCPLLHTIKVSTAAALLLVCLPAACAPRASHPLSCACPVTTMRLFARNAAPL